MFSLWVKIGEHLSEEFKKINPARKVPVIDDGGFRLFERYLTPYLESTLLFRVHPLI